MFVDSHCHINFVDYDGKLPDIFDEMAKARVSHALCISVNLDDFPGVLAVAEGHDNAFASVGVHPDHEDRTPVDPQHLVALSRHPKVVAIGETGLDYYRTTGDTEWQRDRFRAHIRAARITGKPLVIHTRDAAADTLRLMAEEGAGEAGGVMHCFTETLEVAEAAMALGFYISFSGIVTFKNALALKEVAKAVPLDRMLIETDSPYLAPVPHRGKVNQPAWVAHVAGEIARLKGLTVETVAQATSDNFFRLFGIQRPAQ
jgi:TatD DNase family protein